MMLVSGYGLLLIALSIAGVVLLITKRRTFEFYTTPEQLPKGLGGQTAFGNPGMVIRVCVAVARLCPDDGGRGPALPIMRTRERFEFIHHRPRAPALLFD